MFKDWPRGAALWWRRIPTATSGRAVRESDRMLLGSAHAVPMHEGWRRWQSAPRRLANSASQMMHLNPNACTTAGPVARIGMNCWLLAITSCALKLTWSEKCDWKCPSVQSHCKLIYAIYWWIECASNTFSYVTWCSPVFTSSRMCEFLQLKNRK